MTTISADQDVMTLINVFTVDPDQCDELVQVLVDATDVTMRHLDGFVSANIHRSLDGHRVVNYAQWKSVEAFNAMRENANAAPHMERAAKLADTFDPIVCSVADATSSSTPPDGVEQLYRRLLQAWNECDAEDFGALFADEGSLVGFDGTSVESRGAITAHLRSIFAEHRPPRFVAKVRQVRPLAPGVALLRSVTGLAARDTAELMPEGNAVQTLTAVEAGDGWQVAHFQNTPARFDGRPDEAEELTSELRAVLAAES
jgi:uncharacterized protein (TIGR02246 family)